MPGDAVVIQKVVHMLKMAVCVSRSLAVVAIATLGVYHLYYFPGFTTAQAMDASITAIATRICRYNELPTNFPVVSGLRMSHRNVELTG